MKSSIKYALIACSAIVLASSANAATDGTLGASSTGTSVVTLVVPAKIQITDVKDITLAIQGDGTAIGNSDVTVFSNGTIAAYNVTATAASGSFDLLGTAVGNTTTKVPFALSWNDAVGTVGATALTYNTALAAQTGVTKIAGTKNANVSVAVTKAAIDAVIPDTYTTTVSLVVAAD